MRTSIHPLAVLIAVASCTGDKAGPAKNGGAAPVEAKAAEQKAEAGASTPSASEEPAAEPEGSKAEPEEAPAEPEEAPAAPWPEPTPLVSADVRLAAEPRTPTWTVAHEETGKTITLETALAGGLIARIDGAPHVWQDEGFVARPEIDSVSPRPLEHAPRIVGYWPKNAWRVSEVTLDEKQLRRDDLPEEWAENGLAPTRRRFYTYRGHNKWVAQKVGGLAGPDDYTVEDEGGVTEPELAEPALWRVSPRRGIVVGKGVAPREDAPRPTMDFVRPGGGGEPDSLLIEDGAPRAVFETRGGRLFVFLSRHGRVVVQRSCSLDKDMETCAIERRAALPSETYGGSWKMTHAAHRRRHGATFGLTATPTGGDGLRAFALHTAGAGFELEALPTGTTLHQLLAAGDGGLWAVVDAELWHRAHDGGWSRVQLPERLSGGASLQIAVDRGDSWRLWVTTADAPVLFTTGASVMDGPDAPKPTQDAAKLPGVDDPDEATPQKAD